MMSKQKFVLVQFTFIFSVFLNKTEAFTYEAPPHCYNPNGRMGLCVSIYECKSLLHVIKTHQEKSFAFARQSECPPNGQGRRPFVCCTSDTGFTTRTDLSSHRIIFPKDSDEDTEQPTRRSLMTTTTIRTTRKSENLEILNASLFPKPPECGPVTIGNKIFGGEETELGEFPWLANLEYKKQNGTLVSVCAGNIINHRYLLTAAHCVKGAIELKFGKLVSVRVGDHNTQTPVDCDNSGCIDAFQRLGVERAIVHSIYDSYKGYRYYHDIALIRTDRRIEYSNSVAPICLPNAVSSATQLRTGHKLFVAGWGHTGDTNFTAEKRKVEVPYVENKDCSRKVAPEQLCAGGEYKKDSCSGDSGGGLVRLAGDAWIVEGIVSYGRGCGLEQPAVYTRVRSYTSWILDNVQP